MNEQISSFLKERIEANDFPSAVYLVAEKGEIVFQDALGHAVVEPEKIEAKLDTIYDLASLTKPLVTGLLIARLYDQKVLDLNEDIASLLSGETAVAGRSLSLLSLLTHTTGLDAWKPFYILNDAPRFDPEDYCCSSENNERIKEFVQKFILKSEFTASTAGVLYSDLNFLLLGFLLELFNDQPLLTIEVNEITSKLELQRTFYCGSTSLVSEIAASEKGNEYEKQTCVEMGFLSSDLASSTKNPVATAPGSDVFRNRLIWGEVHDGNAYFMGGVAGHAGLFSTAEEVFKIALQFLPNYTQLLKPETCEFFRTNFTKGLNEDRSFAFQLASTKDSTAGTKMSPESFGHNGFTGTSLWIDPVKDRIFILLTNRTHNHSLPFVNINAVRRRFHDLAIETLEGES